MFIPLATPLGRSRARHPRLGRAGRPIAHKRVDLRAPLKKSAYWYDDGRSRSRRWLDRSILGLPLRLSEVGEVFRAQAAGWVRAFFRWVATKSEMNEPPEDARAPHGIVCRAQK
jgi:hypothetical protein